jgi:hypothetical protein
VNTTPTRAQLVLRARPQDVDGWIEACDELRPLRIKHGATGHRFLRNLDDPNDIMLVIEFASRGGARGYATEAARIATHRKAAVNLRGPDWQETLLEPMQIVKYPT